MQRQAIAVLFVCTCAWPAIVSAATELDPRASVPVIEVGPADKALHIQSRVGLLVDETGSKSITEVMALHSTRFAVPSVAVPNYGISNAAVSAAFRLRNTSEHAERWWLSIDQPTLDEVALYSPGKGARRSGRSFPRRDREIQRTGFSFAVVLPPRSETPMMLRVQSANELQLHLSLMRDDALHRRDVTVGGFNMLVVGLLLAMALYNLLLWGFVRDVTHAWYAGFVGGIAVWLTVLDGSLLLVLPESVQVMPRWPYAVAGYTGMVSSLVFARRFLRLDEEAPSLSRGINAVVLIALAGLILGLFALPWSVQNQVSMGINLVTIVACVSAAAVRLRAGFGPAGYFLLGWGAMTLVGVAATLSGFGVLPALDIEISVIVRVGYLLEAAFFAVAMAAAARQRDRRIAAMRAASDKFVPFDFLSHLGRDDLPAVTYGDHVEREMTVYFSDIRSFTSMVERMTPRQTMDLVNRYLSRMQPVISGHGGFIDKFIGDAVMALFDSPDAAVQASIACQRALYEDNAAPDTTPLQIGIGLHTGKLILGTVGSAQRLSCTVLGDSVNLASRIESLTKRYGAALLITEDTRAALKHPEKLQLRRVDVVAVKGKSAPVAIYDVLDALPEPEQSARAAHLQAFAAAQSAYEQGDIEEALRGWQTLAEQRPEEAALTQALARAREHAGKPLPEGWRGVSWLDAK